MAGEIDTAAMPAGGAEGSPGESAWAHAERLAEAHEASLRADGKPVPGADAGHVELSEPKPDAVKPPVKATGKPAAVPAADKSALIKQIEELAAKAGMKVDANRVEVAERVALREEKRKFREQADRELNNHRSRIAQEAQASAEARGKAEAFAKALDSGDFDGMAKSAGYANWREMLNEQTKRMASPEYRRVQELERREAEREKAQKEADARNAEAQQLQKRAQGIQAYKVGMTEELNESGDGQLMQMAEDKDIVDLLYQVADAHMRATGDELTPAEAAETPSPLFGNKSALDLLKDKWEVLNKIFGDQHASDAEDASASARRGGQSARSRERKPPKTVSQRNAAEASAQKRSVPYDSTGFI